MNAFFLSSENSVVLKDGEGVNVGVYIFPFVDMAVLGIIILCVWVASKIIGTVNVLPAIIFVVLLMFLHIIAFQIGLSPMHKLYKRLRRSMIIKYGDNITIVGCNPDKKVEVETTFSIKGFSKTERELQIQRFAADYMKQNYFLSGRAGVDDIYTTEYQKVMLIKETKKYYLFSGVESVSGKRKKFKVYKAYTDIYKITGGIPMYKDIKSDNDSKAEKSADQTEVNTSAEGAAEEKLKADKKSEEENKRREIARRKIQEAKEAEQRKIQAAEDAERKRIEEEERKRIEAEEKERERRENEELKQRQKEEKQAQKQMQSELKQQMKEQKEIEAKHKKELARLQKEQKLFEAQQKAELERQRMSMELLQAQEKAEQARIQVEEQKELHENMKTELEIQRENIDVQFEERKSELAQNLEEKQSELTSQILKVTMRSEELKALQKNSKKQLNYIQQEEIKAELEELNIQLADIRSELEKLDKQKQMLSER